MLEEIFEEQLKLNKKIIENFENIVTTKDIDIKRKWIKDLITAINCECSELLESSGWKWWKKLPDWDNDLIHNLKIETIDILHFLISIMLILDMNSKEVYELYMKKKELNIKRQNEGYKTGEYNKVDDLGNEDNYYLK